MPSVEDYLTKQIYIDKNVVTFRSLSRQFALHVNQAKNELAKFHANLANSQTRSFATYLISGELFPPKSHTLPDNTQTDDGMDVDSEALAATQEDVEEEEEVPTTTILLVGEDNLENAKSRFARIFSVHVYCLSPSRLKDAGLICEPSTIVYKADAKDASTSSILLGRVVGPDVRIGKVPPPVASSSKAPEPIPLSRKPTLKPKAEDPPPEKEKEKSSTLKPKASGKLDWSKAKKSDSEKGKEKDTKVKKEETATKLKGAASSKTDKTPSPQDESKRGTKRKTAPPPTSDIEEQPKEEKRISPTAKSDVKLRKNRVVSDDEDEEPAPKPQPLRKGKSRAAAIQEALESEAEASLRAMMDMDDSQVEKASSKRLAKAAPPSLDDEDVVMASESEYASGSEPPETQFEEDEDMIEDIPKPQPRKKEEKKVIPVGRNGLKKKRVMKTRTTVDAKGYMVTEDYSSYESVDEEEPEEPKKSKGKKAAPAAAKAKKEKTSDDEVPPPKLKPAARSNSMKGKTSSTKTAGQGSLKDFFGKPKK